MCVGGGGYVYMSMYDLHLFEYTCMICISVTTCVYVWRLFVTILNCSSTLITEAGCLNQSLPIWLVNLPCLSLRRLAAIYT